MKDVGFIHRIPRPPSPPPPEPPLLPTTIGPFPQISEVRASRAAWTRGELDDDAYREPRRRTGEAARSTIPSPDWGGEVGVPWIRGSIARHRTLTRHVYKATLQDVLQGL